MRASAASRFSPPAGLHGPRTDGNAPKTDASPFALLIEAGAVRSQKPAGQKNSPAPDKSEDKTGADTPGADAAAPQNKASQPQSAAAASGSQPAARPGDDASDEDDSQPSATQDGSPPDAPAIDTVAMAQAPLPPVSPAIQAAGLTADNAAPGENAPTPQGAESVPSSPVAKPAKPDKAGKKDLADQPAQPRVATPLASELPRPDLQAAAAILVPVPDHAAGTDGAVPAIAPAAAPSATQAAPQLSDPAIALPNTPEIAAAPFGATPAPAPDADLARQATLSVPVQDQPKPVMAQSDIKTDALKPVRPGRTQQGEPAAANGADTGRPGADPSALQPDAPKPGAHQTDATAFKTANAVSALAAQPAPPQAPTITQHVQVTAQPQDSAVNLPALAVTIAAKSVAGAKQFDIRLDPPELGHVDVRLSIDATGKASAHLSADQPQTLSLLQKDAHSLARALRDAGLDVSRDSLNFSLRQQPGQEHGAGAHSDHRADHQSGRRSGHGFPLAASVGMEATAASAAYAGRANGRLDIRV